MFAAVEIDFDYESKSIELGARFAFSCSSNESNIEMFFYEHEQKRNLDCNVTRTTDNRYICTVVKERFGFSDAGRYQCSVTSCDSKHSLQSKSVIFAIRPGMYTGCITVIVINL